MAPEDKWHQSGAKLMTQSVLLSSAWLQPVISTRLHVATSIMWLQTKLALFFKAIRSFLSIPHTGNCEKWGYNAGLCSSRIWVLLSSLEQVGCFLSVRGTLWSSSFIKQVKSTDGKYLEKPGRIYYPFPAIVQKFLNISAILITQMVTLQKQEAFL